ncbi:MAG: transposase [Syntrophorhabdaceae bacterium]|nr:transposase [Syntrophorhabdaceae bacterium]
MNDTRRQHDASFKTKVVLEAIWSQRTIVEIASEYGVHPNQITAWKKQLLDEIPSMFTHKREKTERAYEEEKEELYKQIGQLKVENEWLKKSPLFFSRRKEGCNRGGESTYS